jgi:glycosyltransferase involved in cell wall biosynthesis
MKNIAIISNTSWSLFNFRKGLMSELIAQGNNVFAIAPQDLFVEEIKNLGATFIPIKSLDAKGKNPFKDLFTILELRKILLKNRIQVSYLFTPKINLYGSLSSKFTSIKSNATVNGLGFLFNDEKETFVGKMIKKMYKVAFTGIDNVFFQNSDDLEFFKKNNLLKNTNVRLVRGSGANLNQFYQKQKYNGFHQKMIFLYAGRLIKEKGVLEYLEAAKQIKAKYPDCVFKVVGLEANNPSAIDINILKQYDKENIIQHVGSTDKMNILLDDIDVVVFPSYYREGIPKILIESLAKGLPIITCDSVGCKETVEDGVNGYLVEPKNTSDLVEKIEKIICIPNQELVAMGFQSRKKAENEFDEKFIIKEYVATV